MRDIVINKKYDTLVEKLNKTKQRKSKMTNFILSTATSKKS